MAGQPVWELSAWRSLFADPFAEGNELESASHAAEGLLVLSHIISRIIQAPPPWLADIGVNDQSLLLENLKTAHIVLKEAFELASSAASVQDPAGFNALLAEVVGKVTALPPGGVCLVPGGWRGTLSIGWVMHLIERSADGESFSFTTANVGQGMEYHLASPGHDKTKFAPCLHLSGVPREALVDPAFWASSLALWARAEASEFCRHEVLYDVLLPSLAGGSLLPSAALLPHSSTPTGAAAASAVGACAVEGAASALALGDWRSPARSAAAGAWKCALEALRFFLATRPPPPPPTPQATPPAATPSAAAAGASLTPSPRSFTRSNLKRLTTLLRREMVARALEDLSTLTQLNAKTATSSFMPTLPDFPLPAEADAWREPLECVLAKASPGAANPAVAASEAVAATASAGGADMKEWALNLVSRGSVRLPKCGAVAAALQGVNPPTPEAAEAAYSEVLKSLDSTGKEAAAAATAAAAAAAASSSALSLSSAGPAARQGEEQEEVVLLYFTRTGCEHCAAFTPKLKDTLAKVSSSASWRVVVVSLDRSAEDLGATLSQGDPANWCALPVHEEAGRTSAQLLTSRMAVTGCPCLSVLTRSRGKPGRNGGLLRIANLNACGALVSGGPACFPWEQPFTKLGGTQVKLLEFASELLGLNAVKASERGQLDSPGLSAALGQCRSLQRMVRKLRQPPSSSGEAGAAEETEVGSMIIDNDDDGVGGGGGDLGTDLWSSSNCNSGGGDADTGDDGGGGNGVRPPLLGASASAPFVPFTNGSLLVGGNTSSFAGPAKTVSAPDLPNFLSVPHFRCETVEECLGALSACDHVVTCLMRRCSEGSVTSQLSLKLQACALIEALFTTSLPCPVPLDKPWSERSQCVWFVGVAAKGKPTQLGALVAVHGLMLSFGSLSQAVETPTRASDGSRALCGAAMLAVFDALLRVRPTNNNPPPLPEPFFGLQPQQGTAADSTASNAAAAASSSAAAVAAVVASGGPAFVASPVFAGARAGYVFGTRQVGVARTTGYFLDDGHEVKALVNAAAGAAVAGGGAAGGGGVGEEEEPEPPAWAALAMSELMHDDGGYALDQGVCQDHRPFQRACATMEVVDPALARGCRDQSLAYLASTRRCCAQRLFDLRQPDNLEVSKHGATVGFLRQLLGLCGYQVLPPQEGGRPPPPEMEALMDWMLNPQSPFASHESGQVFSMARDVVLMFKFLSTMETREAELMRKRKQLNKYARFSLSFDPSGGSLQGGGFALRRGGGRGGSHRRPLQWEAVNFRGVDQSIADVQCHGFGGRVLGYGEGLLVRSPADVARLAPDAQPKTVSMTGGGGGGAQAVSEDDVLFAEELPTFGGTLSCEESEALLSFLTVPYARIPLVVGFFATRDRASYLMNTDLQALFSATLFEGGTWVDTHRPSLTSKQRGSLFEQVPLRRYGQSDGGSSGFGGAGGGSTGGRGEMDWGDIDDSRGGGGGGGISEETEVTRGKSAVLDAALGTPHGLLLNELAVGNPEAVMTPLMAVFGACLELRNTSVYSPDAQFIVFLVETAVHVEAYLTHAVLAASKTKTQTNKATVAAAAAQTKMTGDDNDVDAVGDEEGTVAVFEMKRMGKLVKLRRDLRRFLHGPVAAILDRWLEEANNASPAPGAAPGTGAGAAPGAAPAPGAGAGTTSTATSGGAAAPPTVGSADLPTSCVVMAYRSLLYSNSLPHELGECAVVADEAAHTASPPPSPSSASASSGGGTGNGGEVALEDSVFVRLVGGIAFVNNWHGFGLGQQRSDLLRCTGDSADAEQRLLRFLQAHGVDTSAHLQAGSLSKYLTGRPLYLNIGGEVIKVPTVARPAHASTGGESAAAAGGEGGGKEGESTGDGSSSSSSTPSSSSAQRIPPGDVPEHLLFAAMQRLRPSIVSFMGRQSKEGVSEGLGAVLRIALRIPNLEVKGWEQRPWETSNGATGDMGGGGRATGRWDAVGAELTVDLQTTEVLWRNDELKPVPDSMTQFVDYSGLFGKQPLHCGLVARQQHRHWVHVVGSDYDLVEWDVPDVAKDLSLLGLGAPVADPEVVKVEKEGESGQAGGGGGGGGAPPGRAPQRQDQGPEVDAMQLMMLVSQGVADDVARRALLAVAPQGGSLDDAMMWVFSNQHQGGGGGAMNDDASSAAAADTLQPTPPEPGIDFDGERFDRPVDPYSDELWPHEEERWAVALLREVVRAVYPEEEDQKMKYTLYFPSRTAADAGLCAGQRTIRLLGLDSNGEDHATWKEVVLVKEWGVLHVYNLVSHGRAVYRTQVYSSHSRLSLAALDPMLGDRKPMPPLVAQQAGNFKALRPVEGSLVVTRFGGDQVMVPGRLLVGVVPAALLENYRFWQNNKKEPTTAASNNNHGGVGATTADEDGECVVMVGEPIDAFDPWFGMPLLLYPSTAGPFGSSGAGVGVGGSLVVQRLLKPSTGSSSSLSQKKKRKKGVKDPALAASSKRSLSVGSSDDGSLPPPPPLLKSSSVASVSSRDDECDDDATSPPPSPAKAPTLLRHRSLGLGDGGAAAEAAATALDEGVVAQLAGLGFSEAAAKAALEALPAPVGLAPAGAGAGAAGSEAASSLASRKEARLNSAMDWLSSERNRDAIELAEALAMSMMDDDENDADGDGVEGAAISMASLQDASDASGGGGLNNTESDVVSASGAALSLMDTSHAAWANVNTASKASGSGGNGKQSLGKGTGGRRLTLLNLLHTSSASEEGNGGGPGKPQSDCPLHRLSRLLSRVEDLSHILVWSDSSLLQTASSSSSSSSLTLLGGKRGVADGSATTTKAAATFFSIVLIELPRLRLRLAPQQVLVGSGGGDGALAQEVRLRLLDHSGWFISDRFAEEAQGGGKESETTSSELSETGAASPQRWLDPLLKGLGECVVLESDSGEGLQLLLPNHDLHRPKVRGQPFSTMLVADRANSDWQEVMATRYYLYPVHTSLSFLHTPSLAAALYLCLCRFLARDYVSAAAVVSTCTVDVPFTAEERWIFGKIGERCSDDCHPDAHALRLKLSLMVAYSENKHSSWRVHNEMARYLAKLPHVSSGCRLSDGEEVCALKLCTEAAPLLRNRLDFLLAVKDANRNAAAASPPPAAGNFGVEVVALAAGSGGGGGGSVVGKSLVTLKGPAPRWGGQPWRKLCSLGVHHLDACGQRVKRVHYKRPGEPTVLGTAALRERTPDEDTSGGLGGRYRGCGMGGGGGGGGFMGAMMGMMGDGGGGGGNEDDEDMQQGHRMAYSRTPPKPSKPVPDPEIVAMLSSMGFSDAAAQRSALGCSNKGVGEAQEWAFAHMEDPNFNTPISAQEEAAAAAGSAAGAGAAGAASSSSSSSGGAGASPSSSSASARRVVADEAVLGNLLSMGFSLPACTRAAVAADNDPEAAAEWLFAHLEDTDLNDPIKANEEEEPSAPVAAAADAAAAASVAPPTAEPKSNGSDQGTMEDDDTGSKSSSDSALSGAAVASGGGGSGGAAGEKEADDDDQSEGAAERASVKRDAKGEPKPATPPPQSSSSSSSSTPAGAPAAAPTHATGTSDMSGLTFDFSSLGGGGGGLVPVSAPVASQGRAAAPPPIDLAAIMAAINGAAATSGVAVGASSSSAPSSTPSAAASASARSPAAPGATVATAAAAEGASHLSVVGDDACAELLLTDALPMDEESGANRQLGVAFLYDVLTGRVKLELLGVDVSVSLGKILTKYAHLKAARWGRESAEGGEVEAAPSRHFAQLASLIHDLESDGGGDGGSGSSARGRRDWPCLPADGNSSARFGRGFTLKRSPPPVNPLDPMPRPPPPKTAIHVWLESLDRAFHASHHTALRYQLESEWRSEQSKLSHGHLDKQVLRTVLSGRHNKEVNSGEKEEEEEEETMNVAGGGDNDALAPLCPGGVPATVLRRHFYEGIAPLEAVVCDTSCAARPFLHTATPHSASSLSPSTSWEADAEAFSGQPLAPLGLGDFVVPRPTNPTNAAIRGAAAAAGAEDTLPFDLSWHGDAQSAVARDLLRRLGGDVAAFAAMQRASKAWDFVGLARQDVSVLSDPACDSTFDELALAQRFTLLEKKLLALVEADSAQATLELGDAVERANALAAAASAAAESEDNHDTDDRLRFALRRSARQYGCLGPSLLTRALMSSSGSQELRKVNPFLSLAGAETLLASLPSTLLRFNRVSHARRCLAALTRLKDLLSKLRSLKAVAATEAAVAMGDDATSFSALLDSSGPHRAVVVVPDSSSSSSSSSAQAKPSKALAALANQTKKVEQGAKALVTQLLARRHYVETSPDAPAATLDPRFLVFEYAFDVLLRARQVEMVGSFVSAAAKGESRVQQMIMGAGKTTVIGPLLTLLLADGNHLVTQVMPSALLDMSRNVLRKCFSCPLLPKRVYTLSFDRSVDDSAELVGKLLGKLEAAAAQRGVVVAAPEAIKSTVLKLVEQLHSVEQVELEQLLPSKSDRANRETVRLRDHLVARSSMADALVPILELWRRSFLIMDEVDVLLHPLRSELNFPIGSKVPIDLGAQRWDLPFFLLDCLVATDADTRRSQQQQRRRGVGSSGAQQEEEKQRGGAAPLPTEAAALLITTTNTSTGVGATAEGVDSSDKPMPLRRAVRAVLGELKGVIEHGYACHALQTEPHLVLLDPKWYAARLRPVAAKLATLWLCKEAPHIKTAFTPRRSSSSSDSSDSVGQGEEARRLIARYLTAPLDDLQDLNRWLTGDSPGSGGTAAAAAASTTAANSMSDEDGAAAGASVLGLGASHVKLLNLGRTWVLTLLPHVLSKIHRVSFGILRPSDLSMVDPKSPPSRRLLAVPFVGKDVPSRASEFAHPDVLIGLSVLAYRYDGARLSDVQRLATQLKQDLSRQVGPRQQRPAAVTFDGWLHNLRVATQATASSSPPLPPPSSPSPVGVDDESSSAGGDSGLPPPPPPKLQRTSSSVGRDAVEVLPLSLFQPNDAVQLQRLWAVLKGHPPAVHYYLRQHIFPALMNFQATKISACGHELGSSILFGRRIGFSGTPSNLLPLDLGDCQYEPGSDGRVLSVLTNASVVKCERKPRWSALSLLVDVATSAERTGNPVHALIDTGALITGLDNQQVAKVLLTHLSAELFDGVVYLDSEDRQMILLRGGQGRPVALAQVGLPPERRFSFYDQVHTTGMDIKQGPSACAVLTVGKDMTFRDYAQGAFRMRQIGEGQTLVLYVIPEVENRMKEELKNDGGKNKEMDDVEDDNNGGGGGGGGGMSAGKSSSSSSVSEVSLADVPAWLLLNSMRMEGLQFAQLSTQELYNVWRKKALSQLVGEAKQTLSSKKGGGSADPLARLRRFEKDDDRRRQQQSMVVVDDEVTNTGGGSGGGESSSVVATTSGPTSGGGSTLGLRQCVELFREPLGVLHDVSPSVPRPTFFADKMEALVAEHASFSPEGTPGALRVEAVRARAEQSSGGAGGRKGAGDDDTALETMVVNEAEAEAEEEAEEEAEQEEQKMSAFSRDDEQANPWRITQLNKMGGGSSADAGGALSAASSSSLSLSDEKDGDHPFSPLSSFRPSTAAAPLPFPSPLVVSDNYFRPKWVGLGERRLKNIVFLLEVVPGAAHSSFTQDLSSLVSALVSTGAAPSSSAAAIALQMLLTSPSRAQAEISRHQGTDGASLDTALYAATSQGGEEGGLPRRFVAVLSLAEGETLRRALHTGDAERLLSSTGTALALHTLDGASSCAAQSGSQASSTPAIIPMDSSHHFRCLAPGSGGQDAFRACLQCLRFVNCDMYFTEEELDLLMHGLRHADIPHRASFFAACQRLRRRERVVWSDTPLARAFTAPKHWHLLHVKALVQQMAAALLTRQKASSPSSVFSAWELFLRFGETSQPSGGGDEAGGEEPWLGVAGLQRLCVSLRLGFSPADIASVAAFAVEPPSEEKEEEEAEAVLLPEATATPSSSASTADGRAGGGSGGGSGGGERKLSVSVFAELFGVPPGSEAEARGKLDQEAAANGGGCDEDAAAAKKAEEERQRTWDCGQCGLANPRFEVMCERCGFAWSGQREVPPDKWACGTCSFFNSKTGFYCEVCNTARPDLGTIRF